MESVGVAELVDQNDIARDADLAARSGSTILITALTPSDVEHLARVIHIASARAAYPFIKVAADALPREADLFMKKFASVMDLAEGGTVLLMGVADIPPVVQEKLLETLAQFHGARDLEPQVRLIAGTTADLRDGIATGMFSERLFYRLNVIHLVVGHCLAGAVPLQATA